jgi:ABC-2 type transport system ATP-binding protein
MLELASVSRSFRSIPAVEDVSFILKPGEVLGYLGPNGSGKSTTVKMVMGMIRPTKGKVLFAGRNIHDDLASYRAHLGYVPEEAQLYSHLSGLEYLQLVGRLRGMPEHVLDYKARTFLQLLSLQAAQYSALSDYSKGMKQRVLIAAALLHDPQLLVFDEPLSGPLSSARPARGCSRHSRRKVSMPSCRCFSSGSSPVCGRHLHFPRTSQRDGSFA